MSADRDVRAFLDVVADLTKVLRDEILCVKAMRIDEIRAIQEPKARLADAYAEACATLGARPDGLTGLSPNLRTALGRAGSELKGLVAENARLLGAARDVNERLIRMLADAAARQAAGPGAGRYAPGKAEVRKPASVPLAFDRRA